LCSSVSAYTKEQVKNLKLAYIIGKKVGHPEVTQAIILQETLAGKLSRYGDRHLPWGKKSYGVSQIQLDTAKDIIKMHFNHQVFTTDEDIIHALVTNDEFAIHMAAWYFEYLMDFFQGDWKKAVLAYNVGLKNVLKHGLNHDPNKYLNKVIWRMEHEVRPFNRKGNVK
jgi:hypothetical protein